MNNTTPMFRNNNFKERLSSFSKKLGHFNDIEVLAELILKETKSFANAIGGSIFLKRGEDKVQCEALLDDELSDMEASKTKYYVSEKLPIGASSIVGYVAQTRKRLRIEDVYKIPASSPYRFNPNFDKKSGYRTQSLLAVPIITIEGNFLGVLELVNARDRHGSIVSFRKEHLDYVQALSRTVANVLERTVFFNNTISKMVLLTEMRDPKETGNHVNRVGYYSIEIYKQWARRHKKTEEEIIQYRDLLRFSAMLHDVGKVAVPDSILKKPGKLSPEEYKAMQQHAKSGADLFRRAETPIDLMALDVATTHHEKWDGTGYPKGLKAESIPLSGRIVAIADVYDALISNRAYKKPWPIEKAVDYMGQQGGIHFDGELLEAFLDISEVLETIRRRYSSSSA